MSTIFNDISAVGPMPSHIDTSSRIFGRTVGKTTFRSGSESQDRNVSNFHLSGTNGLENMSDQRSRAPLCGRTMGLHNRLNQDFQTIDQINTATSCRTFGLQSRNSSLNQDDRLNHRSNISTVSRTFGLISDDLHNGRFNDDLRRNASSSSSVMPRTFGLHTKMLTSDGNSQDNLRIRETSVMNFRSGRTENLSGLQDNEGYIQDLKRNTNVNSLAKLRSFGLQSRNPTINQHIGLSLNQDSILRSNNISAISKTFGPAVKNTTDFNMQDNSRYNSDVVDNGGFRIPTLTRMIRGRSSIMNSRLFQNQNTKRHCKDLSNINGFNVSHISTREIDTQSDSRFALNGRHNWKDNQSMSGSVLSVTSVKSQFLNLLENLHHSILNIGPNVTAEAVRMQFDKAKQRLENITEMNLEQSVKENGTASIISQSYKYTCPPITERTTTTACIDGGSLNLKSSKDLLKNLVSDKNKFEFSIEMNEEEEEEEEELRKLSMISSPSKSRKSKNNDVFKKPGPYIKASKRTKTLRKPSEMVKNLTAAATNKVINLKQWYPIAVGSDLALCGVDEKGSTVKTDAVKKRINNRKVELVSGLICNLTGSPSAMVSVLPRKIVTLLKNGITDRWRVLQKELLNCQTAEEKKRKRVSKSPGEKKSPGKKKSPKKLASKSPLKTPKVTSTPKKKEKVTYTRSGRVIKAPPMFWIVNSGAAVSSTERSVSEITRTEDNLKKKRTNRIEETPVNTEKSLKEYSAKYKKPAKPSPKKKTNTRRKLGKESEKSPARKTKASPVINKKAKSPMKNKKKESEEEKVQVHSSTEDAKKENRGRKTERKRKRDGNGDGESMQAKKSKLEKKSETEAESTAQTSGTVSKSGKKRKIELKLTAFPAKSKAKKSPEKKKKKTSKKKTKTKEAEEVNEFEEDFELKLDGIEIPEIGNAKGNPQLSRSQLRLISMETPPLKYFNNHLNLLRSATPVRSPSWCISQRTESEVKQFQRRREEAFKKRMKIDVKKKIVTEKSISVQNKDVKRVMEWVAEKTVKSPQWNSKVLQYVIPSRKQLEERMNEEDDEEFGTEFL